MNPEHLGLLCCPRSGAALELSDGEFAGGRIKSGTLKAPGAAYPVVDFVPRFVSPDNYASSFGFQWGLHSRTQYDDVLGVGESSSRLFGVSGWPRQLGGQLVLEAGSGSGRFTEHLLATGAVVVSFDYSSSVAANHASNGGNPRLLLVQADILAMPFRRASFDKVLCLGVLQHTPDPRQSFLALTRMAKPGGEVVTDIYLRTFLRYWLNTRYWVRPITRRVNTERLYKGVDAYVRAMWPVARALRKLPPRLGEAIVWRLLVADYSRQFPSMPDDKLLELAVLDTFDMLSPAFDNPATPTEFRRWHSEAGLDSVDVRRGPNGLVGRGVAGARALPAA